MLLVRNRRAVRLSRMPYPLMVFLVLATASIAWSFYPGSSALGVTMQWVTTIVALPLALLLSWPELLRVLGWVFRLILAMSFLFEFVVSAFIDSPLRFLFIQGNLDHFGPIQGIFGRRNQLGIVALIAIVTFGTELRTKSISRRLGIGSLIVAGLCLLLARSPIAGGALVILGIVAAPCMSGPPSCWSFCSLRLSPKTRSSTSSAGSPSSSVA